MKNRKKELEDLIVKHRNEYFDDTQIIPDHAYDLLEDELKTIDPENPILKKTGKSNKPSPWKKYPHIMKMYSLDKLKAIQTSKDLYEKIMTKLYLQELKLDGLSIELIYKNGKLIHALTRGGGDDGEDIYRNVVKMKNVKDTIDCKEDLSLRAEILLLEDDFEIVNQMRINNGDEPFSNQRNGAGGIARKLDGTMCEYLVLLYYDIYFHAKSNPFKTELEKIQFIESFLDVVPYQLVNLEDVDSVYSETLFNRMSLSFDIDGVVYKMNDLIQAGIIDKDTDIPKAQIAWKFPASQIICILTGITWSIKKGSRITPVGQLEPTHILLPDGTAKLITDDKQLTQHIGVKISNVTLNNMDWILNRGIGIGDSVLIERANDVVPFFVKVLEHKGCPVEPVKKCPVCNHDTVLNGTFLLCSNDFCSAKVLAILLQWVRCLKIRDFGLGRIKKLYEMKILNEPADYYLIKEHQIASIDGMGEKTARKILEQFEANRDVTLVNFVDGLAIENIGTSTIEKIISAGFDSIEKILGITTEDIVALDGLGDKIAEFLIDGLRSRMSIILNLLKVVKIVESKNVSAVLGGKTFCVTGTLSRKRDDVESVIKSNGGKIGSVSKNLNYLVVGLDAGSKLDKAKKLGVLCISEKELFDMIQ